MNQPIGNFGAISPFLQFLSFPLARPSSSVLTLAPFQSSFRLLTFLSIALLVSKAKCLLWWPQSAIKSFTVSHKSVHCQFLSCHSKSTLPFLTGLPMELPSNSQRHARKHSSSWNCYFSNDSLSLPLTNRNSFAVGGRHTDQ